ncbi:hypothetical protein U1Q18_039348, partial [Sarracenia purpurea var. burkii]
AGAFLLQIFLMLQIRATFLLQIVSPFATDRRHHNLLVVKNALLHFVQFLLLVLCSSASKAAFPAGLGAVLLRYIWGFYSFGSSFG